MDIGTLYDTAIADHYDQDQFGLLSGARNLAFRQIETHLAGTPVADVLDLAVGTGESLLLMKQLFPQTKLHGIDLSDKMLEIAKTKLDFNGIRDDVANAGKHFHPASNDAVLMHFLTTFIDGEAVVKDTAKLLKSGGYYSIVSSTYDAFPRLHELVLHIVPEEFLRQANPSPRNSDVVASYLRDAGLEIVADEVFETTVRFDDFSELYRFGLTSGFFTHILARCDDAQVSEFQRMENIFPLEDRYNAAVVLARKP